MGAIAKLLSYLPARWGLFGGYALYVAWSRVLYTSPVLAGGASHMHLHVWSMAAVALASLLVAVFVERLLPRRARLAAALASGVLGVAGSCAIALGSAWQRPAVQVAGYVLVALASSWLLVHWQTLMARGGIRSAVLVLVIMTTLGGAAFFLLMLLPSPASLVCSLALPALSAGAVLPLERLGGAASSPANHAIDTSSTHDATAREASATPLLGNVSALGTPAQPHWLATAPYGLMLIVCGLSFVNGLVRTSGALAGISFSSSREWLSFGLSSVLATAVGAGVAFFAHRRRMSVAFDVALPVIALGCILFAITDEGGGFFGQTLVASGAQVVTVLAWVVLINNAITFGVPTTGVFALLVAFQHVGLFAGQGHGTLAILTPEGVAYAALFLLVIVALVVADMHGRLTVSAQAIEGSAAPTLAQRVEKLASVHGLTPRETEVLAIWAAGHTGAHLERELGISKNTLKTHLGHIYEKLGVANREELLTLVERTV